MSSNRHREELYLAILVKLKEDPMRPTRLMYATRMNWHQFSKLCDVMIESGLIMKVPPLDKRGKYGLAITGRGEELLKVMSDAKQYLGI